MLAHDGYVERHDGGYRFVSGLLEDWWRSRHGGKLQGLLSTSNGASQGQTDDGDGEKVPTQGSLLTTSSLRRSASERTNSSRWSKSCANAPETRTRTRSSSVLGAAARPVSCCASRRRFDATKISPRGFSRSFTRKKAMRFRLRANSGSNVYPAWRTRRRARRADPTCVRSFEDLRQIRDDATLRQRCLGVPARFRRPGRQAPRPDRREPEHAAGRHWRRRYGMAVAPYAPDRAPDSLAGQRD